MPDRSIRYNHDRERKAKGHHDQDIHRGMQRHGTCASHLRVVSRGWGGRFSCCHGILPLEAGRETTYPIQDRIHSYITLCCSRDKQMVDTYNRLGKRQREEDRTPHGQCKCARIIKYV